MLDSSQSDPGGSGPWLTRGSRGQCAVGTASKFTRFLFPQPEFIASGKKKGGFLIVRIGRDFAT